MSSARQVTASDALHRRSARGRPDPASEVLLSDSRRSNPNDRMVSADAPSYLIWQANRTLRKQVTGGDDGLLQAEAPAPKLSYWERNLGGLKSILKHPFSLMLVAFPLGALSAARGWGAQWTFWLNFMALIPLAKILGDATEELDACLHNEVVSGLLNATFGNAVEMIMTIQTLRRGLLQVVKATLLGSVLSNLLLVLGMSFFFGGLVEIGGKADQPGSSALSESLLQDDRGMRLVMEKEQTFIVNSAMVSVTMLLVSCLSFSLPTIFTQMVGEASVVLDISRTAAVIVIMMYVCYLIFQLITHRKMLANADDGEDDDEDSEGLTLDFSLGLLAATTILVSFASEFLVDVIEEVVANSHLSECFIGVILLPIVGNACEHAAAVRFAIQNKPGLSVSIAVGSSTQVALFVVPFSVLMGWYMDQPMTLDFGPLNAMVLLISVLVVLTIVVDGRSNWLEGYMLCSAYALIAVMYWHVKSFDTSDDY